VAKILQERVEKRPHPRVTHLAFDGLETPELNQARASSLGSREPSAAMLVDEQIQRRTKFIVQILLDALTPQQISDDRTDARRDHIRHRDSGLSYRESIRA
jgi:hypothetical protein